MVESHTQSTPTERGDNPKANEVTSVGTRARSSWPILVVAVLFFSGALLTWYFTWFGRELSDNDISTYIVDFKHPRKVQHALVQIQQRIERGDQSAKQWYPQLLALTDNPETELRLTVAWLMGFDNRSREFHAALGKLVKDSEPMVRRNAALALVRFGDPVGRHELRSILEPYVFRVPAEGVLQSSLKAGSEVSRGTLLARLQQNNGELVGLRSPLPGKVDHISAESGAKVVKDQPLLSLYSDEASVWEALRGLALVGEREDLEAVERYLQTSSAANRVKQQAALTIKSIQSRLE